MKAFLILLLLTGSAYAQPPGARVRRDSLPDSSLTGVMPSIRPSNAFYRDKRDPKNVVRATLDNMPVMVPDSSVDYPMMRPKQRYRMPYPPEPRKKD